MKRSDGSGIKGLFTKSRLKKTLLIAFVPLLLIAIVLISSYSAFAGTGDGWDLTNFITGVTVRDSSGNLVTDGSFSYGSNYTFNITFAENETTQFAYDGNGHLIYKLPTELKVAAPVSAGEILLSNGKPIGWYNLDSAGNVEVWFDNVDNQGNPITDNFIDRYQNATFTLSLQASFQQGTQTGTIDFGADATITVKRIEEPPAGVKIDKTATAFDSDKESVDFTVVITAVGGPINQVSLADSLNITGDNIPAPAGYNITSAHSPTGFQYQLNGTGAWNTITPTWNGSQMSFDFSSLGTLQKDQYITLKYSMPLGSTLDTLSTTPSASNPYIQRLMYTLSLNNDATATGHSTADGTASTAHASTATPLKKTFLSKYSSVTTLGGNSTIAWTAAAGDGSRSLNGQAIVDAFSSGQTVTGNITVQLYGYSNGVFTGPTTVTITPPTGLTAYNASTGFTYTVPSGGAGSITDVRRVVFTYSTTMATPSSTQAYSNTLSITLNGNKSSVINYNSVGPDYTLHKSSEWVYDASGNPTDIKYTITVDVPAGQQNKQFYLVDWLTLTNDMTVKWETPYHPANWVHDYAVTLDSPESDFTYSDPFVSTLNGDNVMYYLFGTTSNRLANSIWPYASSKTLTITYEVSLADTVANMTPSITVGELLHNGQNGGYAPGDDQFWSLINEVQIIANNGTWLNWDATDDYWPIHKEVAVDPDDPTLYNYTVYLNPTPPAYNYLAPLFGYSGGAKFEDSFDSRLQYVDKSFYVQIQALDPGQGYNAYLPVSSTVGPYTGTNGSAIGSSAIQQDATAITVDNTNGAISTDFSRFKGGITWSGNLATSIWNSASTDNYWYARSGYRYIVHYQLKVKDANQLEQFSAQNTATVYPNGTPNPWGKPFSDTATVKYGPSIVKKTVADINGNTLDTEVIINPKGADLVPDPTSADDTVDKSRFTAVDTMSGDLAIYLSTIQIYTQGGSVGNWDGVWKSTPETLSTTAGDLFSIDYIDAQHVDIVLPNQTPIRITYKALITVPVGSESTFDNTMSVYGYSDFYSKDSFLVEQSSGTVSADDLPITLYKEDSVTHERLAGAQFGLYINLSGNAKPYSGYNLDSSHPPITVGSKTFYYILDAHDNGDGTYTFSDTVHGLLYQNSASTYLVVENAPPANYKTLASPANRSFFVLRALSPTDLSNLRAQLEDATPYAITDTLTLTNDKNNASIVIEGDKKATVSGDDMKDAYTFQFTLRELKDATAGNYKTGGVSLNTSVTKVTAAGTYHFTFDEIDDLQDGTYYYEIKELDGGQPGWTYDLAPRVITVSVAGGKADITSVTGGDKSLTFTNDYFSGGPLLPLAGGTGTALFTITALILSLALVAGTVIYIRRHKEVLQKEG